MKKFVKMMMVAAIAMTATVACSSDDEKIDSSKPMITASAPAELTNAGELAFVMTPKAEKDVVITIANSDAKSLTVAASVTIKAGSIAAKTAITALIDGTSTLTFTSADANFKAETITIKTKKGEEPVSEYCEANFADFQAYACLKGFILGEKTFAPANDFTGGDYNDYTTEATKIANGVAFTIKFANITSGAADDYLVGIVADWNGNGEFVKVFEKAVKAGEADAAQDITGTITVPADAKASVIRVMSTYSGEGNTITDGCDLVESGSVYDIAYTL